MMRFGGVLRAWGSYRMQPAGGVKAAAHSLPRRPRRRVTPNRMASRQIGWRHVRPDGFIRIMPIPVAFLQFGDLRDPVLGHLAQCRSEVTSDLVRGHLRPGRRSPQTWSDVTSDLVRGHLRPGRRSPRTWSEVTSDLVRGHLSPGPYLGYPHNCGHKSNTSWLVEMAPFHSGQKGFFIRMSTRRGNLEMGKNSVLRLSSLRRNHHFHVFLGPFSAMCFGGRPLVKIDRKQTTSISE